MKNKVLLSTLISILAIIIAVVLVFSILFSQGYFSKKAQSSFDSKDADYAWSSTSNNSVSDSNGIDIQQEDTEQETDFSQDIGSYIDKQVVHDNIGYTLKEFWFSKKLPDGVTTADCSDSFGGWMYDSSTGEGEMKLVKDYTSEDGTFSYEGESYTWLFVKVDIENLFDEDKLINFGSTKLNAVVNSTAVTEGVDYLSLHDNCFVAPEGMDDAFSGEITQAINYYDVYFKKGETREAVFGYIIKDKYISDDSVYFINLDIYGYGNMLADQIGHLYIK